MSFSFIFEPGPRHDPYVWPHETSGGSRFYDFRIVFPRCVRPGCVKWERAAASRDVSQVVVEPEVLNVRGRIDL